MNRKAKEMVRFILLTLVGVLLTACVKRPSLEFVQFQFGEDTSKKNVVFITVRSEDDLDELARVTHVTPAGSIHICGFEEKYSSIQYLHDADRLEDENYGYVFTFPASLQQLVVFPLSGGEITSGWPRDLVNQNGVCFEISGGITGTYIQSEIIVIPALAKQISD